MEGKHMDLSMQASIIRLSDDLNTLITQMHETGIL
jgi:hypothetical protein